MNSMSICLSLLGENVIGICHSNTHNKESHPTANNYFKESWLMHTHTQSLTKTTHTLRQRVGSLHTDKPPFRDTKQATPSGPSRHNSSPVPSGADEVEAAVDAVVIEGFPCHPRLLVKVVLKLGVNVLDDGLPAG